MGPALFSGWGVRTFAEGQGRYNPLGYHNGTVWPFDNSFIAWGLRRYGFANEAGRIAEGILSAATYFEGRLPEAFGGFDRDTTRYPVRYPTAGSPQAWSSGASHAAHPHHARYRTRTRTTWPWTPRCRPPSGGSRSWTSPAAGARRTRSPATAPTSHEPTAAGPIRVFPEP